MIYFCIGICIVLFVVSALLAWANEKYKSVSRILTFISLFTLSVSLISFLFDFDPVQQIKSWTVFFVSSIFDHEPDSTNSSPSPTPLPTPFEVLIPQPDNTKETDNISTVSNSPMISYSVETVFLNIGDKVYRDENNKILFLWVPIAGQDTYHIKVQVDDPFSDAETDIELEEKRNYTYMDVSSYDGGTVMFVSIGIWNDKLSEWSYSSPLSVTLY